MQPSNLNILTLKSMMFHFPWPLFPQVQWSVYMKKQCTVNRFNTYIYRHVMKASPLTDTVQAKSPKQVKWICVLWWCRCCRPNCLSNLRHFSSCLLLVAVRSRDPQMFSDPRVQPYLAHMYYDFGWMRQKSRVQWCCKVPHLYTFHAQDPSKSAPPPQISMSILSARSSLSGWVRPPLTGGSPCVVPKSNKGSQSRAFFFLRVPCTGGHKCWHSHHKGVFCWRPVGETRKGSGCFFDAAGHSQGVSAQGGGHGQVGKLRVKVSEVCGAGLWNHAERTGIRWEFIRTRCILVKWLRLFLLHKCEDCQLR